MENREVACIRGVPPVTTTGGNGVNRWLARFHQAHLDRRGVRPQQDALGISNLQVERVEHSPRRMVRWHVQSFEIVPVVFNLRPLGDLEAH